MVEAEPGAQEPMRASLDAVAQTGRVLRRRPLHAQRADPFRGTFCSRELNVLGVTPAAADDFAEAVALVARRSDAVRAPYHARVRTGRRAPARAFAIDNPEEAMKVLVHAS